MADATGRHDENLKTVNAWKRFLDEEVGRVEDDSLEYQYSMDTEEALEKSEVLRYFHDRRLDPVAELMLTTAFEELTPKEVAVIYGFFWKNMNAKAIAKQLKTTTADIHTAKWSALKKLKTVLASKKLNEKVLFKKNAIKIEE